MVGPLLDRTGHVVRTFADQFAVSVYPWLDAKVVADPDGTQTAAIVARLHAVSPRLPPGLLDIEDFRIPHRAALEDALGNLHTPWTTGPYAEPARAQLLQHTAGVRSLMRFYDALAQQTGSRSRSDWVITHGEPHGPNLLRSPDGLLHLVDWDTALVAPRERDLWELRSTPAGLPAYAAAAHCSIDHQRLRLYEAWYALAEIAVYLTVFRAPHTGDANDTTSWENFLAFLPKHERWISRR